MCCSVHVKVRVRLRVSFSRNGTQVGYQPWWQTSLPTEPSSPPLSIIYRSKKKLDMKNTRSSRRNHRYDWYVPSSKTQERWKLLGMVVLQETELGGCSMGNIGNCLKRHHQQQKCELKVLNQALVSHKNKCSLINWLQITNNKSVENE